MHRCPPTPAHLTPQTLALAVALVGGALSPTACTCDDGLSVVPGALHGRACDPDTGVGLAGIEVALALASGGERSSLTDANGGWAFDAVTPGTVSVTARLTGDDARTFDATVVSRKDTTVSDPACREVPGMPDTGGVDGQLCNRHTGGYVTEALIGVALADGETRETATDVEGRFALDELPAGAHVLTASGAGYQRAFPIEIRVGETLSLDLGEGCTRTTLEEGTLSGVLCDPTAPSAGLAGARVVATDAIGERIEEVTDAQGEFFLNALAPGLASVEVTRAPDVQRSFLVEVAAGRDMPVVRDESCAPTCSYAVEAVAEVGARPVDIVFVVDDSGSMDDDNDAVSDNINAFSASVGSSGVDYRVVLVGSTTVGAPLNGSTRFLHVDTNVDSNDPLIELVDHLSDYAPFLREDSVKHFVAITDDESDLSASAFTATMNATPGMSGFKFHSIVAYGSDPDEGCSTGAAYGHQYMELSAQTGGLTSPICGADYAAVFQAVVEEVAIGTLPCRIEIPPPAGTRAEPGTVQVFRHDGGTTSQMTVGASCTGVSWRLDEPLAPTAVEACPETCAQLSQSATGSLTVEADCQDS